MMGKVFGLAFGLPYHLCPFHLFARLVGTRLKGGRVVENVLVSQSKYWVLELDSKWERGGSMISDSVIGPGLSVRVVLPPWLWGPLFLCYIDGRLWFLCEVCSWLPMLSSTPPVLVPFLSTFVRTG